MNKAYNRYMRTKSFYLFIYLFIFFFEKKTNHVVLVTKEMSVRLEVTQLINKLHFSAGMSSAGYVEMPSYYPQLQNFPE